MPRMGGLALYEELRRYAEPYAGEWVIVSASANFSGTLRSTAVSWAFSIRLTVARGGSSFTEPTRDTALSRS
jgi:hypothetical protein